MVQNPDTLFFQLLELDDANACCSGKHLCLQTSAASVAMPLSTRANQEWRSVILLLLSRWLCLPPLQSQQAFSLPCHPWGYVMR